VHVLVVGGAGYIGSHMVKLLGEKECRITIFDNLSFGYANSILYGELVVGDLADIDTVEHLFSTNSFDVVIHFASSILVSESISNPSKYYRNNFSNTQNLLDTMVKYNISSFVFSSTAAIFGEPQYIPIDEAHPKFPLNAYGNSKWMVEQMLADYDNAYGLKSICLRYFNACGADPNGKLGERHEPETHLIPLILQVASGRRDKLTIFGQDYETKDGTCIRDYIHVTDLVEAHWLALQRIITHKVSRCYNLGNGNGFSVKEVVDLCRVVTGRDIQVLYGNRRKGDPTILISNSSLAETELKWKLRYSDLYTIVHTAWCWEIKNGK